MDMAFTAQLWKYTGQRLENKNGHWMYMEETWILPNEKTKRGGQEIRNSLGTVLNVNLNNKGNHLKLQHKTMLHFINFLSF